MGHLDEVDSSASRAFRFLGYTPGVGTLVGLARIPYGLVKSAIAHRKSKKNPIELKYKIQKINGLHHSTRGCFELFPLVGAVILGSWDFFHRNRSVVVRSGSIYRGPMINGLAEGFGSAIFVDGRKYIGEWKEGEPHGQGMMVWYGGETYQGKFVKGEYEGLGLAKNPDGSQYYGLWKNSQPNGEGKYTSSDGVEWKGIFKNGQLIATSN